MLERCNAEREQMRNRTEGTLRWIATPPLTSTAWSAACGRLSSRGGFPHARDPRPNSCRAPRHVRGPRGTRDRGGGRRSIGRIKQVEPTERKEKIDGTYRSTSRRPDASAAE